MVEEILLSVRDGVVRVAHVTAGQLQHVEIASIKSRDDDASKLVGGIYLGRVERVVSRLQAAFVDIGEDRSGFLGAREARVLVPGAGRDCPIEDCVGDGDTVLVQVTRPPLGDKGAQVTADITLAGHAVVIAPCRSRVAISRSIEDPETRARLETHINDIIAGKHGVTIDIEGMEGPAGWVVRTAAADMNVDELARDMAMVSEQWTALLSRAQDCEPPFLLHMDLGPIERALRDGVKAETKKVTIEGDAALRVARAYCKDYMPAAVALLHASEEGEFLFDRFDVEDQIQKALNPRVELPSGGWLMIETTEAMTTIDVNSGSHDGTALAVNLEAAAAIARQVQLRGVGGLIAVDFIDMTDGKDKAQVGDVLSQGFDGDRQAVRFSPMSDFGVIEMTRRRPAQSLAQALRGL